ncbi:hypothetical protein BO71DRAFT_151070 [Aspergillus ellipticus CBS 707.79]|uniref:Uncharacterized protein n=1 Tax=Aspergillus ellipticus CBS 707.79 TaxID=1448320 RepID=A0A319DIW3_9EURO|nr:hypothetical protein BO71DRAFT_151070 [Aspergillus ellipticus CBS 707.79]
MLYLRLSLLLLLLLLLLLPQGRGGLGGYPVHTIRPAGAVAFRVSHAECPGLPGLHSPWSSRPAFPGKESAQLSVAVSSAAACCGCCGCCQISQSFIVTRYRVTDRVHALRYTGFFIH